jgi:hypothetical protein
MINLRKDVERVVRPIRASTWRKNQMREELLAHLEGLLAEEKARRGDDVDTVRRARARFGEPGPLTTELQATVPRWVRWAFVPVPVLQRGRRRPGETLGAYQRRWIARMTCLVLVWGGFAVGCALVGSRRIERTGFFLVQVLVCTLLFGLGLLAEAIRRSLMRLESADPAACRTAGRGIRGTGRRFADGQHRRRGSAVDRSVGPRAADPAPHFLGRDARERASHAAGTGRAGLVKRCPGSPVRPVGRPRSVARCVIRHASTRHKGQARQPAVATDTVARALVPGIGNIGGRVLAPPKIRRRRDACTFGSRPNRHCNGDLGPP